MSYRRTRAVFIKELRHIVRDKRSLGLALAMPVMMLMLYGFALSLDVDHVPALVYDQDGTAASRDLIRDFRGSRYFDITGEVSSYRDIQKGIDKNTALMGVVIPRDFGKDLEAGRATNVQLLVDGSDSNTAAIAMGYAENVVQAYSAQVRAEIMNLRGIKQQPPAVEAEMRVWYNSSLESKNFVVPGLIAIILMILTGQLTTLTIAREWEMGTMEQILSTPLRPVEMVLGKMLAYFVVGLVDAILSFVSGVTVFGVPFRGSLLVLSVSTLVFLCGALFWGIFISAGTRTQVVAYQMGMLTTFLPGFLLSGFVFAIDTMPRWIQLISIVVPSRYFITILKAVFLKGAGWAILWPQLAYLLLFTTYVFWRTVKRMNQKVA
ncbi:MAG TPA: ABC transporter permease [Bryobacteraceae bacterium]|nr:ABC transporter permease [Bryobacteraceae bacterium]